MALPLALPPGVDLRWISHDPSGEAARRSLLTDDERALAASFGSPARRRAFVLGRAAARTLLAERLRVAPPEVPIVIEPSGAPCVAADGLYVSIAHAGEHAVAVVGPERLGVDLEVLAPRHPDLARRLLHPDEHAPYAALPLDDLRRPLLLWTIKEATLKALRTGFRRSPRTLRAAIDAPAGRADVAVEDPAPGETDRWRVVFAEHAGCFVAVARGYGGDREPTP